VVWSKHSSFCFAEDISKVMVDFWHSGEIGGIDRSSSRGGAELCVLWVDVQCEVGRSHEFASVHECSSAYE